MAKKTILLAEKLGVSTVVDFSGCPGDSPDSKRPNWVTCPWPPDFLEILNWQWAEVVTPYWKEHGKFAADHGVAAAGVSKYPIDVTAAMLSAYRSGRSTVSAFASVAGATVHAVDVGVGRPTGDIRTEPALSTARFDECVEAAFHAVDELDTDLLVLGEMGIGNTTAAAAVAAAIDRSQGGTRS